MHRRLLVIAAALALAPAGSHAQTAWQAPARAGDHALAALPADAARPAAYQHVRVHAHILLLDRAEATRVGLRYAQVGGGLIGVHGARAGRGGSGVGVSGELAGVPISAFLDVARDRGILRSATRTQVLALSGASAAVSSGIVSTGRWGATRVRGPELLVTPTVLDDGSVLLEVRARLRDEVSGAYGWSVDGSPVDVVTSVIVRSGEDATVGSVRTQTQRSDVGLLSWRSGSDEMDILVVLRPEIVEL
jgi:hypothetical protein